MEDKKVLNNEELEKVNGGVAQPDTPILCPENLHSIGDNAFKGCTAHLQPVIKDHP